MNEIPPTIHCLMERRSYDMATSPRSKKRWYPYIMFQRLTGWWLNQPIWKIWSSKWVHLPQFSGWKLKIFELPPPDLAYNGFGWCWKATNVSLFWYKNLHLAHEQRWVPTSTGAFFRTWDFGMESIGIIRMDGGWDDRGKTYSMALW